MNQYKNHSKRFINYSRVTTYMDPAIISAIGLLGTEIAVATGGLGYFICIESARRKKVREMEQEGNVLLKYSQIEEMLRKNPSDVIKILNSAVITHEEVDGKKYHITHPLDRGITIDLSSHRKALVADGIGDLVDKIKEEEIETAVSILENLSKGSRYINILSYGSLGAMTKRKPSILKEKEIIDSLRPNTITNEDLTKTLANLALLDRAIKSGNNTALEILSKEVENSNNPYIKDILGCYINLNKYSKSIKRIYTSLEKDKSIKENSNIFSRAEIIRGLKIVDFPEPRYIEGTTEYKVFFRLAKYLDIIGAAGRAHIKNRKEIPPFDNKPYHGTMDLIITKNEKIRPGDRRINFIN